MLILDYSSSELCMTANMYRIGEFAERVGRSASAVLRYEKTLKHELSGGGR